MPKASPSTADLGLIGMAVMGRNLALNMADRGFAVSIFNRSVQPLRDALADEESGHKLLCAADLDNAGDHTSDADLRAFVLSLKKPRRVMMMVKAGPAVDSLMKQIEATGLLEEGDVFIDGGNSHYPDTERRIRELAERKLQFLGVGISGGEEGARRGPSIMPGGSVAAWPAVKEIFQAISAKAPDGAPCCDWVGDGGAGHYVKMVHNGIEYGDMQLICEAYHLMSAGFGMDSLALQSTFEKWNAGELESFLIEITAKIFQKREKDGAVLVDKILDAAGQKGTGKWTGINALDLGVPLTLIAEAVFARALSAAKQERVEASKILRGPVGARFEGNRDAALHDLHGALLASKIVSYAQGFQLMRAAAKEQGWKLDYRAIASLWRGGCIIRSSLLGRIMAAFEANPDLPCLLLDPYFAEKIDLLQAGWRHTVQESVRLGIPIPAFSSALSWYDGYRSERLPANLLQAQRDFFGAHTFERVDKPRGEFFHADWS